MGGSFTFHIFVCLEKGGYAIFLTLMGGGQHFFPYSEVLSATPPSAEIYEQSLRIKRQYGIADNSSNKVCKPCIQTIKRMNRAVSWQSSCWPKCLHDRTYCMGLWLSSRPYSLQPIILVQHGLHSSTCFSLLTVSIPLLITLVPSRSRC